MALPSPADRDRGRAKMEEIREHLLDVWLAGGDPVTTCDGSGGDCPCHSGEERLDPRKPKGYQPKGPPWNFSPR